MHPTSLTDSEWKIMTLLWRESLRSMRNIQDALFNETGWSKYTIISFLKRMITKGAISVEDTDSVKLYRPLLDEAHCLRAETHSMLEKLYDGSVSLMVTRMIEQKALSDAEIDELIAILKSGKEGA